MKYSDAAPVQIMSPSRDFFFDSAATGAAALYASAPSSPKPFGEPSMDYFYNHASAPTSPTRALAIYNAQFDWDEKAAGGFGFSFAGPAAEGGALDEYSSLTPADELFEAGKIRPLKKPLQGERGRERRDPSSSSSESASRSRRASRSLSPMRGEVGRVLPPALSIAAASSDTSTSFDIKADGIGGGSGSKRWRLRDLFLFRSASEGRATGRESKDPLRKYTALSPSTASSPSSSSSSVGRGTSRGRPAALEIHYRASRAANEELRKKTTPLAYQRLGLFGSVFSRGRT